MTSTVAARPRPSRSASVSCSLGEHGACTAWTWDDTRDDAVSCSCSCHPASAQDRLDRSWMRIVVTVMLVADLVAGAVIVARVFAPDA